MLENRLKETVVDYLNKAKAAGLFNELEEVTIDMWDGYAESANEVFGDKVKIVIDLFHVIKNFQEELTKARRACQKSLSKEEAKALKGSRWLWCTNSENLTSEKLIQLNELKKEFPTLSILHDFKESLQGIFRDKGITTTESGGLKLREWIEKARQLGFDAIDSFIKTLENWFDKIVNYFPNRSSNGRTEGFNRGLRTILWRACGMQNFSNFRLRVLQAFSLKRPEHYFQQI